MKYRASIFILLQSILIINCIFGQTEQLTPQLYFPIENTADGKINFSKNGKISGNQIGVSDTPLSWITIMSQNFEGIFPSGLWQTGHPSNYVDAYWDDSNCLSYAGSKSGFCAAAGTAAITCNQLYPNNMFAYMIYGPFDLSDADNAEMTFYHWINSEFNYDVLAIGASLDGVNFWGGTASGNSNGWLSNTFDLTNVYNLGNLCGQSQVWIGFYFITNYSVRNFGAYIDNIVLRKSVPEVFNDITLETYPTALNILADGTQYTAPITLSWQVGSTHTIGTLSPQGNSSTRNVWQSWNNSGQMNQSIIVPDNVATYTANFSTEHYFSIGFMPSNSGSVTPSSGWKLEGTNVSIQAFPNTNYEFVSWTGSGTGSYSGSNNPETIIINGPVNELATFQFVTEIKDINSTNPTEYVLHQNFPNPFNPTTRIYYAVPKESQVTIKLFNTLGEEVQTLVNEIKSTGNYWVDLDGRQLQSGMYIYQISTDKFKQAKKMILLK